MYIICFPHRDVIVLKLDGRALLATYNHHAYATPFQNPPICRAPTLHCQELSTYYETTPCQSL